MSDDYALQASLKFPNDLDPTNNYRDVMVNVRGKDEAEFTEGLNVVIRSAADIVSAQKALTAAARVAAGLPVASITTTTQQAAPQQTQQAPPAQQGGQNFFDNGRTPDDYVWDQDWRTYNLTNFSFKTGTSQKNNKPYAYFKNNADSNQVIWAKTAKRS